MIHESSSPFSHWRTRVLNLGGDRGPYIQSRIPQEIGEIVDIGCSYGWTLGELRGKASRLTGIDMDAQALAKAKAAYPEIEFIHQTAAKLPFESARFDVVILSEVIEHVGEENKQLVIDEAYRVLKPGGMFLFTAPYAGLFAWADPMDFKRRCRPVYKLYMRVSRYSPSTSLEVGHKHLSDKEIDLLFGGRFEITDRRYCGLLMPGLTWILSIGPRLKLLPKRLENALNRFRGWESGVRVPRFVAFNIRIVARKKPLA